MSVQQDFNQEPKPVIASDMGKIMFYIFCVFIIPIIWYVIKGNEIKRIEQKVNEADSGIDVQLKKRRDMLTKMVDTVRQSMKFEQSLLVQVTSLRNMNFDLMTTQNKVKALQQMQDLQRTINVQMEAYPQLMNGTVIKQLNEGISNCEDDISASRRIYNSNVSTFNQTIITWPANVIASNRHLSTKPFFSATQQDKQDVDINLGF